MPKRRWADLGPGARAGIIAASAAQFALQGAVLIDLGRRDAGLVRGPKAMWAALSFVNWAGPVAYLVWGRRRR